MSDTELAWAAGIFEGEGTVSAARPRKRVYIRAAITQHGGEEARSLLQRLADAVGVGNVLGPYDYSGRYATSQIGKKPRYVLAYQNDHDVAHVMSALDPFFTDGSPKRIKYHELLVEAQQEKGGERTP